MLKEVETQQVLRVLQQRCRQQAAGGVSFPVSIKSTPPSVSWLPLLVPPRRMYSSSLPALSHVQLHFLSIVVDELADAFFIRGGRQGKQHRCLIQASARRHIWPHPSV